MASGIKAFTLAFVLDSGNGQVGWGGNGSIANDAFPNGTTVQSQIQAIRAAGADVTISFGGANGTEAALTAPNAATLQARYQRAEQPLFCKFPRGVSFGSIAQASMVR